MMENTGVAVQGNNEILTALQVKQQVQLIQEVMAGVMQEGQHYGKIPGCGDKPTLLKPGAEKLSMTFRLRPVIDNDRDVSILDMGNGHREIRVYCHIMNMAGIELATGVGSCSTMESKYRYRGGEKKPTGCPVPTEYWNLKKEGKIQEALDKIGGAGFGVSKINGISWEIVEFGEKMENSDIADTYNTVLKMAKKRAYVDGILSATAASDIFTQDIEDITPDVINADTAPVKSSKPQTQAPQEKPVQQGEVRMITPAQKNAIQKIFIHLKIEEPVQNDMYVDMGVGTIDELTMQQASDLIKKLSAQGARSG
ncbi:MAG: hypothetical protein PHQ22_10290 [Sulfuricurvum sp.]|jgi:hypothetical protein|nr:hypothetical protein [Sulfuricurvum sp.]